MTERELNRLGRRDLLKLLLIQSREAEDAMKKLSEAQKDLQKAENENQKMGDRIGKLERNLEALRSDRKIMLEKAGSIAEASLQLSGVFKAAQDAANLYIENLQQRDSECRRYKDECRREVEEIVQQSRERCDAVEAETQARCDAMEKETREKCEELERETRNRCIQLDEDTTSRCQALESETTAKCNQMLEDAKQEANRVWESLTERIQSLQSQCTNMGEMEKMVQTQRQIMERRK